MRFLTACRASALATSLLPHLQPLPRAATARFACSASDGEPGVGAALASIRERVAGAAQSAGRDAAPRLVAVSKTKPTEALREAYDAGQRDFGENYVQELVGKAPQLPTDVSWRFIGKLQSNKAKVLVHGVPSLAVVETLDSTKLANKLQAACDALTPARAEPLGVMVQVNTSPWEGTKSGVPADEAVALARHVVEACPGLRLVGLMTIGAAGDASCFETLRACRAEVAAALGVPPASLELSMGMSGDFEQAIAAGSDSVRVGSSIFGARDYSKKA
jgi:pyridoxal phosphate enzyme (YggS family)